MDVLNDILDTINLRGALYFRTEFTCAWGVTVPDLDQAARFHLVVQGNCHVQTASGKSAELGPGDLVIIPRGQSHILANETGQPAPPLESLLERLGYDGNGVLVVGEGNPGASTQLVCGHFSFRHGADHALLRALPEFLVVTNAQRAAHPWLDEVLRLMVKQVFSKTPGAAATIVRLSEMILIEVLRAGIGSNDQLNSIFEALSDEHIGKSLQLIHQHPSRSWSVESLAVEVGMSRSRFAARFKDLTGSGPMAYLSDWRLQKALALLDTSRTSVQRVAIETGYQSPAAFSRAFSGKFGHSPSEYRRLAM